VKLPERHAEDDHPEQHRERHLEQVAEERPRAWPAVGPYKRLAADDTAYTY